MSAAEVPARTHGELTVQAERSPAAREFLLPVQRLIRDVSVGGFTLLGAAVIALIWANSPWGWTYPHVWTTPVVLQVGDHRLAMTLRELVNDGLMSLFFFAIALEVKREFLEGHLSKFTSAALPITAALGGMIVPAAIYLALNAGGPAVRGWAVPMATDIAFSLAVLGLLGNRVPAQLRAVVLAYATVDDLGAILVIAVYYSSDISWSALAAAALLLVALYGLLRVRLAGIAIYLFLGLLIWLALHTSGIHATIAGVLLGFMAPSQAWFSREDFGARAASYLSRYQQAERAGDNDKADAVLGRMEELTVGTESSLDRWNRLTWSWVSYLVLPIFALANAGVVLSADGLADTASSPVAWGIAIGLFVGNMVGILTGVWLGIRLGLVELPKGVSWGVLAGFGFLGGIGFTMSLFITDLAFDSQHIAVAKVAILSSSLLAGVAGYAVLRATLPKPSQKPASPAPGESE